MESDQNEGLGSRNGVHSRAGTVSEAGYRKDKASINRMRPKSEVLQGANSKELETSFEVSMYVNE